MAKVAIIGAGLIGNKRADALRKGDQLLWVSDKSPVRAKELAEKFGAKVSENWREVLNDNQVEAVIVATSNDAIPECATAALLAGKHVLVEKPAGRFPAELKALVETTEKSNQILRVGFNHRFHPAFQKAKRMLAEGAIGELMYFRARYGHGGRVGYDREWRADPAIAGGGELLDQGVHLIDLCRWLGGEFELDMGRVHTFFWDMPVEDNGFLLLKSPDRKRYAFLHASCTEWKNLFDFEIFGKTGKLQIFGIGRSYGVEELRHYKRPPEGGAPDLKVETFPGEDLSWQEEWQSFTEEMAGIKTDLGTAVDAYRAVTIVHEAYQVPTSF